MDALQQEIDAYDAKIQELEAKIETLNNQLEQLSSKQKELLLERKTREHAKKLRLLQYKAEDFKTCPLAFELVMNQYQYNTEIEMLNEILKQVHSVVHHPLFIQEPTLYMETEWRKAATADKRNYDLWILPDDAVKDVIWKVVKNHKKRQLSKN